MSPLESLQITPEMIDEYLAILVREGKSKGTLRTTRGILRAWYESLPKEKYLTADAIEVWERLGREKLLSERTIYNQVMTVKAFLRYLENPDGVRDRKKDEELSFERASSRAEYHLLLQTAKEMGARRAYLLIKTVVCLGIRTTEIAHLRADELTKETVWIPYRNKNRSIKIFEPIRTELLEYAAECGIKDGAVFVTQKGQPMQHFLIWKEIKMVCRRLNFPEHKGTPKSLYQLYVNTRNEVAKESAEEADKNYQALLQEEEAIVGWNQDDRTLIEESANMLLADTTGEQGVNPFDKLSREEEDRVIQRLGESLSEILSRKHDCKITITFTRKEDA